MRPLKLIMTAFGPYAGAEVIDFSKLNNKNIFLITGPTGAGKTTIFDGISYAIYGDASGGERDGESLRSQFADIDTLTSVELEFEIKGKTYYIKRIPKQEKAKSRGEGTTEQKADAEMKVYSDGETKTISGVNNVNEKINEIMGINCQQFKQIMMIPQGEFRKLLTSDSKDREKILQKIFGTEGYKIVEFKLIDISKGIRIEVDKLKNLQIENVKKLDAGENEALRKAITSETPNMSETLELIKEQINQDASYKLKVEEQIKLKASEIEHKQENIFVGIENKKKFDAVQEFEIQKSEMDRQKDDIEAKAALLEMARKALMISASEESYLEKKKRVELRKVELNNILSSVKESENSVQQLKNSLNDESLKEKDRQKLVEGIAKLKNMLDKVKGLEDNKAKLEIKEKELLSVEKQKNNSKDSIAKLKSDIEALSSRLEKARKASGDYIKLESEADKVNQLCEKFIKLKDENNKLIDLRGSYAKYKANLDKSYSLLNKEKEQLQLLEDKFYKGQAAILAENLKEGSPCPVCGSIEHPALAKLACDIPKEDDIKRHKERLEAADKAYKETNDVYTRIQSEGNSEANVVASIQKELSTLLNEDITLLKRDELTSYIDNKLEEINNQKEKMQTQLTALEKEKNLENDIARSINDKKELLLKTEKVYEKAGQDYVELLKSVEQGKTVLNETLKELPDYIHSEAALTVEISKEEEKHNVMVEALKKAEKLYNDSVINLERLKAKREELEKSIKEETGLLNLADEKYRSEIKKGGFSSEDEYKKSKLSEEKLEEMDKLIKTFNERMTSITDGLNRAIKATKGLVLVDIAKLEEEHALLKIELEKLSQQQTELHAKLEKNKELLKRIAEIYDKLKVKEREYSIVGDLAEAARGNNRQRLTFERYVLAAFFDEIIEAANQRLVKMTSNRYFLSRIDERAKGNAQSGLELEVYDNYTGKKRHVKTLSGGEGFKASLSLALGLADVVQSYSGGISLDTMFIDEGFGTLDPESLDGAINCLIELQKTGRLVGIISHVPELKERIDARLEIEPGMQGSTSKFYVS